MKGYAYLLSLFISVITYAQAPPPAALPNDKQVVLIEKFVEVSHYEKSLKQFGMNYMHSKMFRYANGEHCRVLSKAQAEEILKKFDFDSFKKSSIYNAFAFVSEDNLKKLIDFFSSVDGKVDPFGELFISSNIVTGNFTGYLNKEIEKIQNNTK